MYEFIGMHRFNQEVDIILNFQNLRLMPKLKKLINVWDKCIKIYTELFLKQHTENIQL